MKQSPRPIKINALEGFVLGSFLCGLIGPRLCLLVSSGTTTSGGALHFLVDVVAAVLLLLICRSATRQRVQMAVFVVLYGLVAVGTVISIEHLIVEGGYLAWDEMRFGLRAEFTKMNLRNLVMPMPLLILLLIPEIVAIAFLIRTLSVDIAWLRRMTYALPALLVLILMSWLVSRDATVSHQNILAKEIGGLAALLLPSNVDAGAAVELSSRLTRDLEAGSVLSPKSGKPNVLLIMMESVPGYSVVQQPLDPADPHMPRLRAWAQQHGRTYKNFFSHQRRTNRGSFSILCGRYPNMLSQAAILDYIPSYLSLHSDIKCLPKLLRQAGYSTTYFQAADLDFMNKSTAMPELGFSNVIGRDQLEGRRYTWGVGDEDFYPAASAYIQAQEQQGTPWFVTLLNIGTHYPFEVPSSFVRQPGMSDFAASVDHLDLVLTSLLTELQDKGVLKNTLVMITADESRGSLSEPEKILSQNWIPMIVSGPGVPTGVDTQFFAQADVAISVADYLGIESTDLLGRSIFREYQTFRPFLVANIVRHELAYVKQAHHVQLCHKVSRQCFDYTSPDGQTSILMSASLEQAKNEQLSAALFSRIRGNDFVPVRTAEEGDHPFATTDPAKAGWIIEYFDAPDFTSKARELTVDKSGFNWGSRGFMPDTKEDHWSVRMHGCLVVKKRTQVTFEVGSDDGAKLFLNNIPWLGDFSDHPYARELKTFDLKPGSHYLRIDYYDRTGKAAMVFRAGIGGEAPTEIPAETIHTPRRQGESYRCDF